jgi:hypothetical protein
MPLSEDSREVEAEAEVERHIGGDDAGGEAVAPGTVSVFADIQITTRGWEKGLIL